MASVYENENLVLIHGEYGLKPLKEGALEKLFPEKEKLYIHNSAINIMWRDVLDSNSIFGKMIGHVIMPENRSMIVKNKKMLKIFEPNLKDLTQESKKK